MNFFLLLVEVESFAYAIHKFQRDTSNKKIFCINSALQELDNCVAATKPKDPLLDVSKKKNKSSKIRFFLFL